LSSVQHDFLKVQKGGSGHSLRSFSTIFLSSNISATIDVDCESHFASNSKRIGLARNWTDRQKPHATPPLPSYTPFQKAASEARKLFVA
jgi:hypothetical protein